MSYSIPASTLETLYQIKKSKFYARAGCVTCRAEAMAFIESAKVDYPDARHHCWAYQLGSPTTPTSAAMSDDGEPSGTAGKPILNVLQHKPVGDVMVVVSRYFGGIKLGAGGLVRAYSASTQQTMSGLPIIQHLELHQLKLICSFKHEQAIRHCLEKHEGRILQCDYQNLVVMTVALPPAYLEQFTSVCANLNVNIIQQ